VGRVYEQLHSRYYRPEGEYAPAGVRYCNPELDTLIDQVMATSPFDPKAEELTRRILMHLIANMPAAFMFDCKKFSPYDTYYWTGFPSGESPYWSFLYWCAGARYILPRLRPAKAPIVAVTYVTVYAKTDIAAFIGADGKSYGPYAPGEAMVIPKGDADRLVGEGKATYTSPVPPEVSESLSKLVERVSELESTIATLTTTVSDLKSSVSELSDEVRSMSSTILATSAVTILLVIIVIALLFIRVKPSVK
jgi:hypothetical protein